jgi:hypothetical protein
MDTMTGEQLVAQALDTIRQAYKEAAAIIEHITDPQEAFDRADELANGIRRVYDDQATKLRAAQVGRIWEAEEMTLTELAGRISRSQPRTKQRAHQLLQAALEARKE